MYKVRTRSTEIDCVCVFISVCVLWCTCVLFVMGVALMGVSLAGFPSKVIYLKWERNTSYSLHSTNQQDYPLQYFYTPYKNEICTHVIFLPSDSHPLARSMYMSPGTPRRQYSTSISHMRSSAHARAPSLSLSLSRFVSETHCSYFALHTHLIDRTEAFLGDVGEIPNNGRIGVAEIQQFIRRRQERVFPSDLLDMRWGDKLDGRRFQMHKDDNNAIFNKTASRDPWIAGVLPQSTESVEEHIAFRRANSKPNGVADNLTGAEPVHIVPMLKPKPTSRKPFNDNKEQVSACVSTL